MHQLQYIWLNISMEPLVAVVVAVRSMLFVYLISLWLLRCNVKWSAVRRSLAHTHSLEFARTLTNPIECHGISFPSVNLNLARFSSWHIKTWWTKKKTVNIRENDTNEMIAMCFSSFFLSLVGLLACLHCHTEQTTNARQYKIRIINKHNSRERELEHYI